jgi:hypothetical protein
VLRELSNGTAGSGPRSPFPMPKRTEVPRAAPTPSRAARVRQDVGPIRHSVGGKEANGQISPCVAIQTRPSIAAVACNLLHCHDFMPLKDTHSMLALCTEEALARLRFFLDQHSAAIEGAPSGRPACF